MASLWMKIFINGHLEFPLYRKIVHFGKKFTWSLLKTCQLNAHTFNCGTTFISFHPLNTPKRVMPGGGTSVKRDCWTTGRLKTNLTDGHKQSSEFVMATKIPCQGTKKAMNQYAEGIACPIEMLILWHFGNSCSTFTARTPWKLTKSKGCKMSHFLQMAHFPRPPCSRILGILGLFLGVVWQARFCLAVMRRSCPKSLGEFRFTQSCWGRFICTKSGAWHFPAPENDRKHQE